MTYKGSGGNVYREFDFGKATVDPEMTLFGEGVETEVLATGLNSINGAVELTTAAVNTNSAGVTWPADYRPGIMQDGRLREANGTLVTEARVGFPSLTSRAFFFGILEGLTGVDQTVSGILSAAAGGALTLGADHMAGFFVSSAFTDDADQWRCVATGDSDGSVSPVLVNRPVEAGTNYMNVSPALSPTLSIEVVYDGTVEFYYNGDIVRRVDQAVDPSKYFSPLIVVETLAGSAAKVGVDFFCEEFRRYFGEYLV